jgi:hypothetical protein
MSADTGQHIAELFEVPLNEFTRARNAKAAQLKAAGHGVEAQAIRRLGRPTVSLWAANQLARLVPKQVSRFIDLVQEARRKQLSDPRAAAETMQAQRTELTALTNRAAEAVTKARLPHVDRGAQTDLGHGARGGGRPPLVGRPTTREAHRGAARAGIRSPRRRHQQERAPGAPRRSSPAARERAGSHAASSRSGGARTPRTGG